MDEVTFSEGGKQITMVKRHKVTPRRGTPAATPRPMPAPRPHRSLARVPLQQGDELADGQRSAEAVPLALVLAGFPIATGQIRCFLPRCDRKFKELTMTFSPS